MASWQVTSNLTGMIWGTTQFLTRRPISFLNRSIERKLIYILNSSLPHVSWKILALWLEKHKSTLVPVAYSMNMCIAASLVSCFLKWSITLLCKSWGTVEDEDVDIQPEISPQYWFDHQDFQQRCIYIDKYAKHYASMATMTIQIKDGSLVHSVINSAWLNFKSLYVLILHWKMQGWWNWQVHTLKNITVLGTRKAWLRQMRLWLSYSIDLRKWSLSMYWILKLSW